MTSAVPREPATAPVRHPTAMRKLLHTWVPLAVPLVGWTLAWIYVWQAELLERYGREPGPGLTVFEAMANDLRVLWIASGVGLFLSGVGVSLLVDRGIFAGDSPAWSRVWLASGAVLTIVGLSLPILFPSITVMVIDERAEVFTVESRWLYAETADVLTFGEIARVNLRVHRTVQRVGNEDACQVATGLSIVLHDRTWLDIPSGFDHEAVASGVSDAAGVALDRTGADEC